MQRTFAACRAVISGSTGLKATTPCSEAALRNFATTRASSHESETVTWPPADSTGSTRCTSSTRSGLRTSNSIVERRAIFHLSTVFLLVLPSLHLVRRHFAASDPQHDGLYVICDFATGQTGVRDRTLHHLFDCGSKRLAFHRFCSMLSPAPLGWVARNEGHRCPAAVVGAWPIFSIAEPSSLQRRIDFLLDRALVRS